MCYIIKTNPLKTLIVSLWYILAFWNTKIYSFIGSLTTDKQENYICCYECQKLPAADFCAFALQNDCLDMIFNQVDFLLFFKYRSLLLPYFLIHPVILHFYGYDKESNKEGVNYNYRTYNFRLRIKFMQNHSFLNSNFYVIIFLIANSVIHACIKTTGYFVFVVFKVYCYGTQFNSSVC